MLLTITCEGPGSDDLSYLLRKDPSRAHERELTFGKLTVVYPEYGPYRATAALVVEVDPIHVVRGAINFEAYVSDRGYAASALTAVALREAYSSALGGKCPERPDAVAAKRSLTIQLPPSRGKIGLAELLFEPLGYAIAQRVGAGDNMSVLELRREVSLQDALRQLYVLLPVLDSEKKYYFVEGSEVEKLERHGAGWLETHPAKKFIVDRYLRHKKKLVGEALAGLAEPVGDQDEEEADVVEDEVVEVAARTVSQDRRAAVLAAIREVPHRRIVDMGCGEGALVAALAGEPDPEIELIFGVDPSPLSIQRAGRRLARDRKRAGKEGRDDRVTLTQGSTFHSDSLLRGADVLALVEVIEHVNPDRVDQAARVALGELKPARAVVTTPNADANPYFSLAGFRHRDHRFEWTRAQFQAWAKLSAERYGYTVDFRGAGSVSQVEDALPVPAGTDPGPVTQIAVFDRRKEA